MGEIINARCHICGNQSSYDEESIKGNTHIINGIKVIICCPCEDDLLRTFLSARISKDRMADIATELMSDEREDLLGLYGDEKDESEGEE